MTEERTSVFHFRQVAAVLRRRWRLICTITAVVVLAAATLGLVKPVRYTAKAQILYDPPQHRRGKRVCRR